MAAHRSRRAVYPGRSNRQHAHLLSAGHVVPYIGHADSAGGRAGADRSVDALASPPCDDRITSYHGSTRIERINTGSMNSVPDRKAERDPCKSVLSVFICGEVLPKEKGPHERCGPQVEEFEKIY